MLVAPKNVRDFEIVIGLVAPIGTNLDLVARWLDESLLSFGYASETIRLSRLMNVDRAERSTLGYYESAMNKGDELREKFGTGDVLAGMAVVEMMALRKEADRSRRHAFVLRGLKHPDEVSLLRQTYGSRLVIVSVFDDRSGRAAYLEASIRDESPGETDLASKIAHLIDRDELDATNKFGQHVRDAFGMADYFLALGPGTRAEIERIVGLIFGEPFHTPTSDEVAMFHAYGASLRSADPGRQVGAVVTSSRGEVLSTGANEVPRAGGGEYWGGDIPDGRDFKLGYDFNKRQSRRAVKEFLDAMDGAGMLSSDLSALSSDDRMQEVVDSGRGGIRKTRVLSLIEFGRIVHAEMSAITQLARTTSSALGGTLYTTAFPCHMCMRLIVSAGIVRVVYVDPYPKSLAYEMYSDSITPGQSTDHRVAIEPFVGSSWTLYPRVFEAVNRDRDSVGAFEAVDKATLRMRLADPEPLINAPFLEDQIPYALSEVEDTFEQTLDTEGEDDGNSTQGK